MRCVQAKTSSRPSVSEVVEELKKAMKIEEKAYISIYEEFGYIESGDSLAGPVCSNWSERKEMEWSDNRSKMSKVGR
jgi:hypothetical protein